MKTAIVYTEERLRVNRFFAETLSSFVAQHSSAPLRENASLNSSLCSVNFGICNPALSMYNPLMRSSFACKKAEPKPRLTV